MRSYSLSLALATFLISIASANAVEINVLAPGVAFNAGLPALAEAYTKKTGVQVNVKSVYLTPTWVTPANMKATVIIQHDARDVEKLPAFPAAAK